MTRGGEVVSRKAHNLEIGGAIPPPATTLSVVKVSLADLPSFFMYYIYILFSFKDRQLYTGYTDNLQKRVIKHQKNLVRATRNRQPLKLIYYECYLDRIDAKRREVYFKGGKGKGELKIQLNSILKKLDYKNL